MGKLKLINIFFYHPVSKPVTPPRIKPVKAPERPDRPDRPRRSSPPVSHTAETEPLTTESQVKSHFHYFYNFEYFIE